MSAEEGPEWVLIGMDEKVARKQGMPFQIPIPKQEIEGLADSGLKPEMLRGWIKGFLDEAPVAKDGNWRRRNSNLVSQLEGYVDKLPLWEKAQKLFASQDHDAALKTLKRITVMCPDDDAARMNYASALANAGEYDKAFKQLRQIRQSFGGEPEFHVSVAQVQIMRGEQDAAVAELLEALEAKPDHLPAMDALAKLGLLTRLYDDPKDAGSLTYVRTDSLLEYLQELWQGAEHDVDYYLEQMGYHHSERRHEAALEAADRARAAAGDEPNERAELGRVSILRDMGRLEDAANAARAYVDQVPGSAVGHVELAASLRRIGQAVEAAAAVDRALALDPGDQQALVVKFWPEEQDKMMDVQEALPALSRWAAEHPQSAGAWRSVARAKLVVGADDEALSLFAKAVAIAPDDDDLRSEWWGELAKTGAYQAIVDDSKALPDMAARDWKLRWNEAEAYRGLGRAMEARACFMQINADPSLHVDIRKRAKRAAAEPNGGEPRA